MTILCLTSPQLSPPKCGNTMGFSCPAYRGLDYCVRAVTFVECFLTEILRRSFCPFTSLARSRQCPRAPLYVSSGFLYCARCHCDACSTDSRVPIVLSPVLCAFGSPGVVLEASGVLLGYVGPIWSISGLGQLGALSNLRWHIWHICGFVFSDSGMPIA